MYKIKLKEKLGYGFGSAGYLLPDLVTVSYLTLYGTDVLGLSPAILGIIILIPKITDIVTDFLAMNVIDRTRTKYGTYRPWLLSIVPFTITFILLFSTPGFLKGDVAKLIWITVLYILESAVFETAYWCPYFTLTGVMTDDENERTSITSIKSVFESVISLLGAFLVFPVLKLFGDGYRDPVGWRYLTVIWSIFMIASAAVTFFTVKERVSSDSNTEKNISLLKKFIAVISNAEMIKNILISAGMYIVMYMYYAVVSYFYIYVMGREDYVTVFSGITVIISIFAVAVADYLSGKLGKEKTIFIGAVLQIAAGIIFFFINDFWGVFIFATTKAFGLEFAYIPLLSDIPRISEQIMKDNDGMKPGVVFGIYSAIEKLAIAAGGLMGTVILTFAKYDGTLEIQSEFTRSGIRYGIAVIMIVFALSELLLSSGYIKKRAQ